MFKGELLYSSVGVTPLEQRGKERREEWRCEEWWELGAPYTLFPTWAEVHTWSPHVMALLLAVTTKRWRRG